MKQIKTVNSCEGVDGLREVLKSLLRGYTSVNQRLICSLQTLGFEVSRKRSHYVLSIHTSLFSTGKEDTVLEFVLSGTPSDKRAGLNLTSTICNTIKQHIC